MLLSSMDGGNFLCEGVIFPVTHLTNCLGLNTLKSIAKFKVNQFNEIICVLSSHIKEHLKDVTDVKQEPMSDEDLQFHYFKLHDYDDNNKLDGIELGNAMTHFHEEDGKEDSTLYTDEQLGSMIDQILEEDDTNKDGYIDYTEFVGAQKRVDDTPEKASEQ